MFRNFRTDFECSAAENVGIPRILDVPQRKTWKIRGFWMFRSGKRRKSADIRGFPHRFLFNFGVIGNAEHFRQLCNRIFFHQSISQEIRGGHFRRRQTKF